MEQIAKADTFFIITSIAVIVIALLFAILMVYLISVLREVKSLLKRGKEMAEKLKIWRKFFKD